ncbi:MAG: UDP-N-acetylmuramoyl-tripeptide--D-alanyl-D-alanine ligase [Candidatus Paceibacterota bacterium]|jgi:UDP-N-acetylmuramoyl-tripeptide--D-alanyl-D-alanine ligase
MIKENLKKALVAIITAEAKMALRTHAPKIIAVTGSVGKTSTKDAIYASLKGSFSVRKSDKSFNSEIGLPLTILGLDTAWSSLGGWVRNVWRGFQVAIGFGTLGKDFPEWLVLEVGADHPGDIERAAKWLHPDIVVLTRMSETPVHVEFFATSADVLAEKMFLAKALKPGGTLVVNADDQLFMGAVNRMSADIARISYGESKSASSRILESEVVYDDSPLLLPRGQYVILSRALEGQPDRVELRGVLGRHLMYPIAAAHAVVGIVASAHAKAKGGFASAFADFESPRGRMRILDGKSQSAIIDDTYNSSPLASMEALKALGALATRGRKIAVLGDMKELGDLSEKAHGEVGTLAGQTVHTLVTVGAMGEAYARGALGAGLAADRIISFTDSRQAGAYLADMVRAGDVVLVKGSQSMRMERVSEVLLADPSKAGELLVRQEDAWQGR